MWSDWLVFCDCGFCLSAPWCPLSVHTFLLGFLWPWTWGISSQLFTAPELHRSLQMVIAAMKLKDASFMAPHSSTLAWKIPWTKEPGGLQSMGSWRVGHDWTTSLSLFTFMHWRRKWQPTPVFLPGESQGQGSLVGCRRTESDTTEAT